MSYDLGCRGLQKVHFILRHKLWRASLAAAIWQAGSGTVLPHAKRLRFRYNLATKKGRGALAPAQEKGASPDRQIRARDWMCDNYLDRVYPASRHYTGLGRRGKG